jgi:hypothetical protein
MNALTIWRLGVRRRVLRSRRSMVRSPEPAHAASGGGAARRPGRDTSGEFGADVDGHRKAQSPRGRTRKELTDEICIRATAVAATRAQPMATAGARLRTAAPEARLERPASS